MLVLRTLVLAPLHGYGIAKAIRTNSSEALDIEFGSSTQRSNASKPRRGSPPSGRSPNTTAARNITGLRPRDGSNSCGNIRNGPGFVSAIGQIMGPIPGERQVMNFKFFSRLIAAPRSARCKRSSIPWPT